MKQVTIAYVLPRDCIILRVEQRELRIHRWRLKSLDAQISKLHVLVVAFLMLFDLKMMPWKHVQALIDRISVWWWSLAESEMKRKKVGPYFSCECAYIYIRYIHEEFCISIIISKCNASWNWIQIEKNYLMLYHLLKDESSNILNNIVIIITVSE